MDDYAVHKPVCIRFSTSSLGVQEWKLAKPTSARDLPDEQVEEELWMPWVEEEGVRKETMQEVEDRLRADMQDTMKKEAEARQERSEDAVKG